MHASSIQAKPSIRAAAGHRPSQSGYRKGAGSGPAIRDASQPAPRAIARQGLNARKTSPNRMLAGTRPTQKIT